MRVGFGYDVHRLVPGRPLILGGVVIDHPEGLDGHSDADVLLHAITDAVLGAAAMGDIGSHFPDTDPAYKDADSVVLLQEVLRRVGKRQFRLVNIDATIAAQAPKLRPHIDAMRSNIARVSGLSLDAVSVKATTTEQLGFVGAKEGMAAYAVCLIEGV
ncbi:MAG: 2-C-methyl-D-erythritol 2,4-cyclodiphosphate synthase [Bacteroidetes bacterium]|nr:2-C-methyl-D-erythritol 2,4-cyclodiphosphate synthase [Bacteroidota bacterium]